MQNLSFKVSFLLVFTLPFWLTFTGIITFVIFSWYPQAPLTAAESVKGMLEVIANLTEKETGTLLDWKGNSIPW